MEFCTCKQRFQEETKLQPASPGKIRKSATTQRCHQHTCGHWKAHIKYIADFLVPEEGVLLREIEEEDCIKFFDVPDEIQFREQGPSLHHFCSSNIRIEKMFLQHCWKECILTSQGDFPFLGRGTCMHACMHVCAPALAQYGKPMVAVFNNFVHIQFSICF